jgi:hypothetical protein
MNILSVVNQNPLANTTPAIQAMPDINKAMFLKIRFNCPICYSWLDVKGAFERGWAIYVSDQGMVFHVSHLQH